MHNFKLQSLFWQLAIPMTYVAIFSFVITIYSANSLKDSFFAIGEFYHQSERNVKQLEKLEKSVSAYRTLSLKHLASENAAEMTILQLELKNYQKEIQYQIAAIYKEAQKEKSQYFKRVQAVQKDALVYIDKVGKAVKESEDFEKEAAFVIWSNAEEQYIQSIEKNLSFLLRAEFEKLILGKEATIAAAKDSLYLTIAIGVFGGISLLFIAFFVIRRISKRVLKLLDWSKKFSEGDLSASLEQGNDDELGQLIRAMDLMANRIRRNQHQLEVAKVLAEEANEAKSQFLANMSHEFRTPLHGILSYSKLGQSRVHKVSREKLLQFFINIQISGDRLLNLVNDLLDIAALEAGKVDIHKTEQDLADILNRCKMELLAKLQDHQLTLNIEEPEHNEPILCDGERITQVIINLLSNAIKFSPNESVITIRYEYLKIDYKSHVKVVVQDQGQGIPEKEREQIFQMFCQSGKPETTAGMRSTGLGLAICQQIIHMHEGKISIEDAQGGGTIISFVLPVW